MNSYLLKDTTVDPPPLTLINEEDVSMDGVWIFPVYRGKRVTYDDLYGCDTPFGQVIYDYEDQNVDFAVRRFNLRIFYGVRRLLDVSRRKEPLMSMSLPGNSEITPVILKDMRRVNGSFVRPVFAGLALIKNNQPTEQWLYLPLV